MLILGGTFDPPHIGHLVLGECARTELGEEQVVLMPAGDPWRKTGNGERGTGIGEPRTGPSPARMRLVMTRLAARDANGRAAPGAAAPFVVDDREVRRRGPTYTVETLAELSAEGHSDLVLLLGSDALADLPHWREPRRLLDLARVAVAEKPGAIPFAGALAALEAVAPGAGERMLLLRTVPALEVSSTLIRGRVRDGLPISYLVPRPVDRYIARHGLYRR
jgi:nicotinate-nucleotide adenylyltransferase